MAANYHIPTHKEDANQYQQAGDEVKQLPDFLCGLVKLQDPKGGKGQEHANSYLHDQQRKIEVTGYQQLNDLE